MDLSNNIVVDLSPISFSVQDVWPKGNMYLNHLLKIKTGKCLGKCLKVTINNKYKISNLKIYCHDSCEVYIHKIGQRLYPVRGDKVHFKLSIYIIFLGWNFQNIY